MMKANKFLENRGYGKGSNFTTLSVSGLMEAYANYKLEQKLANIPTEEVNKFLNMILNSYKVITNEDRYRQLYIEIVQKADKLKQQLNK